MKPRRSSAPRGTLLGMPKPLKPAPRDLLPAEWACLGILAEAPVHGYTVAQRLAPEGDVGRIWSVSRALTYRALDHLVERGYVRPLREEQGVAGGVRTLLTITPSGRRALTRWLGAPVEHLRDVRTEFLLKVQLSSLLGVDHHALVERQRRQFEPVAKALAKASKDPETDPVSIWRAESARATLRFLDRLSGYAG